MLEAAAVRGIIHPREGTGSSNPADPPNKFSNMFWIAIRVINSAEENWLYTVYSLLCDEYKLCWARPERAMWSKTTRGELGFKRKFSCSYFRKNFAKYFSLFAKKAYEKLHKVFARIFVYFRENIFIFALFSLFRENTKIGFRFNPSGRASMRCIMLCLKYFTFILNLFFLVSFFFF
jgi:hypothetical protein